ncbi:MAG: hypothetical protein IV100_05300 [Myxococcales bacterium]|nr:hypothetical protein [Myxococcales bacterium]
MKRLSVMMVTSLSLGVSACGGAVQTETGPAGSASGALSTNGALAPSAPLDKALSAPTQLTMPLAPTPMPKAALAAKVDAASTLAASSAAMAAPTVAAPVADVAVPAVGGQDMPAVAAPTLSDAKVAPIAVDSKYLTADERLKLLGLAVETVCLGFSFEQTEFPRIIEQLHAAAGLDAKTLDRHLPSLFSEASTAEALGSTRQLCSDATALPEPVELPNADRPLLDSLIGLSLGVGDAKSAVVDEAAYHRVVELLRTREDFRKAFVREAVQAIEAISKKDEQPPVADEATQPGGPSEALLPQVPNDDPPADGGCTSDKDCKGDRICVDQKCVNPPSGDAPPADPNEPAPDPSKPTTETLRFSGSLSGSGSVSFRIKGRTITGATASVQGINFSLKSSGVDGKGGFQLIGNSGGNYVRIRATYSSGKKWVKGSFEGTINKRKISGSVTASAR